MVWPTPGAGLAFFHVRRFWALRRVTLVTVCDASKTRSNYAQIGVVTRIEGTESKTRTFHTAHAFSVYNAVFHQRCASLSVIMLFTLMQ